MKKVVVLSAFVLMLAGCGGNTDELNSVKEQNDELQARVASMEEQIKNLQAQLDDQVKRNVENMESITLETLTTDGNQYILSKVEVETLGEENIYEAMLRTMFPILTFNYVTVNGDNTITIDIHKNSTGSPNMTASAQVATFLDRLEYTLQENFPQLSGYYLTSNGESTYLGDFGPIEGLKELGNLTEDKLYMPIAK